MATSTSPLFLSSKCWLCLSDVPEQDIDTVALILGDQLNADHSWYREQQANRLFVMYELRQETEYCQHHIQKVVGFFAAMRKFASALAEAGHQVLYLTLDHADNQSSLTDNLARLLERCNADQVHLQQPDEYRLDQQLSKWSERCAAQVHWYDTEHFLTERTVLEDWFGKQANYMMEHFYRRVRKQTGYLMDGDKPADGQWNFDKDNRKTPKDTQDIPQPLTFSHDVTEIYEMLEAENVKTLGAINASQFIWPLTRKDAKQQLADFTKRFLPHFGDYQDAMLDAQWSLYHSRLSFALNSKMISPRVVVEKALSAWRENRDEISLNQIEGFVRQIIGWREFVRAIYWQFMPEYGDRNHFNHRRALPEFYWHGETRMNCLAQSIQQSLEHAYAHHIQRLMVTGNFALLAGCDPDAVDAWYLGIYIDAIEWVELPNTRGMSQYADGGVLATKPYISSGSYIHKMSDYCASCDYDVKQKTGAQACPFNYLYWNFIDRHYDHLQSNGRMGLILKQWEQRDSTEKKEILNEAEKFLEQLQ
ncbi:cryptochrome/photolyase family protein [Pseudidiomarina insulisalsae]|uniref:Cryptochrome/photolyase family protein n=1 Tax=Pseudidiomarina insulisalsae TaxID=575789 RepID=A0A432YHT4_9GAMM|nr:cryptochrome/photolyase family protein [Pseudidiomarina insulisalsae]RUO60480.1 cryptochrome/photolyase family protein [Pseudidiomarina insulisalsae]